MTSCTCAPGRVGEDTSCAWVRGKVGDEIVGHVDRCPRTGNPCTCLPGSTAHAYCAFEAEAAALERFDSRQEANDG